MNNILQKCAEILCLPECGYSKEAPKGTRDYGFVCVKDNNWPSVSGYRYVTVNPFVNAMDSREQADAIEDYLRDNERELWHKTVVNNPISTPSYKWRLDRIKWCIEELIND